MAAGITGFASMLWLGLTAAVAANQRRLVFNPTLEREVKSPRSSGHRTRPVVLRANDGTRLSGWLMTPTIPGPRPAVRYSGGRSEEGSWVVGDAGKLFPILHKAFTETDMSLLEVNPLIVMTDGHLRVTEQLGPVGFAWGRCARCPR